MKTLIALTKDNDEEFHLLANVQCQNEKVEELMFFSVDAFLQWLILCGNIPIPDVLPKTLSALKTDLAQVQDRFQKKNDELHAAHCSQWLRYLVGKDEFKDNPAKRSLEPGIIVCTTVRTTVFSRIFFSAWQLEDLSGSDQEAHIRHTDNVFRSMQFFFHGTTGTNMGEIITEWDSTVGDVNTRTFAVKCFTTSEKWKNSESYNAVECILDADLFLLSAKTRHPMLKHLWQQSKKRAKWEMKSLTAIATRYVSKRIFVYMNYNRPAIVRNVHIFKQLPNRGHFCTQFTKVVETQMYPWVGHSKAKEISGHVLEMMVIACCWRTFDSDVDVQLELNPCHFDRCPFCHGVNKAVQSSTNENERAQKRKAPDQANTKL